MFAKGLHSLYIQRQKVLSGYLDIERDRSMRILFMNLFTDQLFKGLSEGKLVTQTLRLSDTAESF
jgi:hypothetical protein